MFVKIGFIGILCSLAKKRTCEYHLPEECLPKGRKLRVANKCSFNLFSRNCYLRSA